MILTYPNIAPLLVYFLTNVLCMTLTMFVAWYVCEKIKNATFIDVVWSISFASFTCYYSFTSSAPVERKLLLLLAILPWSIRLFLYLFQRSYSKHPAEDKRYASFRQDWGKNQHLFMLLMFQFQGFLIAVLSMPIATVANDTSAHISMCEFIGTVICLIGFIGESIADEQVRSFTAIKSNTGKSCNIGLWNYSRHPNYFFEWTVWIGIFVLSLSSGYGLLFIYCPLIMLYLLTQVSGVKLSEGHSIKSRLDYKAYQSSTSSFFPWFKRKSRV